ncbi:hypothetical protein K5I29_02420 [Flavobacterium agricola]|uniref:Uncharacterized protein n=1 Tax=Flavobacterium agricola TaxID=2870839 RepID=A0ABY6LZY9_9FLAO|nr:hypothetical protein [Flavobacterium agricola]UYW01799.1 hypothetical protein K5I29_02420 [Flavobacterium agricola]
MAVYNTLKIRFLSRALLNQSFTFSFREVGGVRRITYTLVNQRTKSNQVTKGNDVSGLWVSKETTLNFISAFNADYAALGFKTSLTPFYNPLDVYDVLIKAPTEFENPHFISFIDEFGLNPNDGAIEFVLGYEKPLEVIQISNISYISDSSDPCNKIKAVVTTNYQATGITSPYNTTVNSNPFEVNLFRNSNYVITAINEQTTGSVGISTPPLLDIAAISVNINATPYSNSVNITYAGLSGLLLEFSLNGQEWQSDNTFPNLLPGDFTLYVRDQYGCQKSKWFTIEKSHTKVYLPYFYYSKSNSIRFAYRVNFGDAANYKNDENSLSHEADVLLPYKQEQLFQSADVITTQFKSNYTLNKVWVIAENNLKVEVPVVKKTSNLNRTEALEAKMVNIGNRQTGVFFISGNRYDYKTNQINGSYTLNGLLPSYCKVGHWIQLDGIYYEIQNIVYEEVYGADMLVLNKVYDGPLTSVIVKSEFNFEEFEIYEFTIDMVNYINKKISIKLEVSDSNFPTITLVSEILSVKVKHEDTLEIRYYNDMNNDVFYQTGIQHLLRIPFKDILGKDEQNHESYKTDTTSVLLHSEIYESNTFVFEPLTKEIWRKLKIALASDNVIIDGVGYIKNNDFETEGPLGQTNLYVLTAEMLKTGNVQSNRKSNYSFDSSNIEVPGLVQATSDYLKYN